MSDKSINYREALNRINEIVNIIENDDPDIDDLTEMVNEATNLIGQCKDKLQNAETHLQSSLNKLNS